MDELKEMLSVQDAHLLLKQFDCLKLPLSIPPDEQESLRQALFQVASRSDYQILGVCAETFERGHSALKTYAKALGYNTDWQLEAIEGPVYIKFNPKTRLCYVSPYIGEHRGVLVSCQSAYESGVNEIYGHLPLDLFALD